MAIFTFPDDVRPAEIDWLLMGNSQLFSSPLNRQPQTAELPGISWMVSMQFEKLKRSEIASLEAFIAQLRGQANRALLWHHARENPRGSSPGAPLVNGAGQTGSSINTDGWTASQSGILLKGDLFEFGGELKRMVVDADSDVSGESTLVFEPPIRVSPVDNAIITTVKPTAKFMLADNRQGVVGSRRALNGTSLSFVEDLRA